ncbi:hypothetical protein [Pseudoroseomonas cervicalis]|uniref:hypothetical protein n=1 Tax=Teichococcus cervicalis TaxID=204525 RepID=UPI0027803E41|nr:hypothetical protein [Pseudoroseomonas cervicalis]MDQ1079972.1 hypothetical protein [Pseudoroseomonas cervicalis]
MRRAGPALPGWPAPRSALRLAPWPGLFAALAAWAALDAVRLLAWPAGLLPEFAPLLPLAPAALAGLATARRWGRAAAAPWPGRRAAGRRGPLLALLLWLGLLARLLVALWQGHFASPAQQPLAQTALVLLVLALVISLQRLRARGAGHGRGSGSDGAESGVPHATTGHGMADCGDGWGSAACDSGGSSEGGVSDGGGGGDGGGSGGE